MGNTFIMLSIAMLISAGVTLVRAESHTIRFNNQCGVGTPQLVIGGKVLSNGEDWTSYGPAQSGIAYLQTGPCLLNGENCALLEYNLNNPACPGCGSSVDISLIEPHALNVPLAFSYFDGCDGQGAICTTSGCNTAFHNPDDNQVQVACQQDNVNLLITFCPNDTTASPAPAQQPSQSTKAEPTAIASPASHSPSHSLSLHPYASNLGTSIAPSAKPEVVSYPTPPPSLPLPSTFYKSSAISEPKPSTLVNVGKSAGKPPTSDSPPHSLSLHPYASNLSTSIVPPAKSEAVSYPTPSPSPLPSTFYKSSAISEPKPSTLVNAGKSAGKPSGKTCTRRRGHRKHGHSLPYTYA